MKKNNGRIAILDAELRKQYQVLERMANYLADFQRRHPDLLAIDTDASLALSQALCNYYTCLETMFLRISQFFENNLRKDAWHRDLLDKMQLNVPGFRIPVIRDATHSILTELLKFRHFCRYYFAFDYDREKLAALMTRFAELQKILPSDLSNFFDFVKALENTGNR
jgi:hypothetical protein